MRARQKPAALSASLAKPAAFNAAPARFALSEREGMVHVASPKDGFGGAARRLPRYPVPVALIGRLAVDRRKRGRGLGSALLAHAFRRIIRTGEALAIHAFIVDAVETPRTDKACVSVRFEMS